MPSDMRLDHLGVVVRDLRAGIAHWEQVLGYRQLTRPVVNESQKTRVVFLEKPGSLQVKLLEPLDATSPVSAAARKGGVHHLCFYCEDLERELQRLRDLGLRILVAPEPGPAFGDGAIAFVYAGQGLLLELTNTEQRTELL